MPAEWEPHRATHLAFPSNCMDWPGKFSAARWAFMEMTRHIAGVEQVHLAVTGDRDRQRAERMLADAHIPRESVELHPFDLDRGWMRDISPFFVRDSRNRLKGVLFRFTGWSKYANHTRDARWAEEIVKHLEMSSVSATHDGMPVVMEGGAVDTNGRGDLLAAEECLLDEKCQVRNPGFSRSDYAAVFKRYLGIDTILWLGAGIVGDDTHGHVDDICRFVNPDTVLLCEEKNSRDTNHAILEENRERLEGARLANGGILNIERIPMPSPLLFRGVRLPASYANFYIANGLVLVPTFNDDKDRKALGIIAEFFPDRRVVGIHAVDLAWGFGTLHCLSHEEPAAIGD